MQVSTCGWFHVRWVSESHRAQRGLQGNSEHAVLLFLTPALQCLEGPSPGPSCQPCGTNCWPDPQSLSSTGGHNLQLGLGGHDKIKHIPKQPKAKKQQEEGETWRLGQEKVRRGGSRGSGLRSAKVCQEPGQVLEERNTMQRTLVDS